MWLFSRTDHVKILDHEILYDPFFEISHMTFKSKYCFPLILKYMKEFEDCGKYHEKMQVRNSSSFRTSSHVTVFCLIYIKISNLRTNFLR